MQACTSQGGGEDLESKSVLTVNEGEIDAETYDDAMNASKSIVINRGKIYCNSSGNDAIDSNGTLTITGRIIIAVGSASPEGGFDCVQSTFKITGGTIIGIGGSSIGAVYTEGTKASTFTTSSMVTTIGNTGGTPRGRGGKRP